MSLEDVVAGSFARAVARREPDTPVVVDPRDGTILDLANHPHEQLVDVLLELREREARFKEWRVAVEDELVQRHGDRRAAQVVGDHEVDVDRGYSRVWDISELEPVIDDLLTRGLITRADAGEVFKLEPKVDGRKAAALLNRATDDALVELRRCFSWQQRGRAKVKVTPVSTLEPSNLQVEGEIRPQVRVET